LKSSAERTVSFDVLRSRQGEPAAASRRAPIGAAMQAFALTLSAVFGLAIAFAFEAPRLFDDNDGRDVDISWRARAGGDSRTRPSP